MKKYELMIILKPLLPQDIRQKTEDKIKEILKEADGQILSSDVWGKKHLAYPINKHEDGYYIVYKVELDESQMEMVEKEMHIITEILRYMFVIEE
ncbi:30S ribosomal protein S6 [Candidatus Dojkabacteria bacterium]|uniref:Small ribosomal subunit protein bS6 n=1 Tax=Candidatus Dojkabacteria bacterium TaxID=2099670 RepID=A0A955L3U5_9BACT|nr:30S ribosomal protein S6 [Candidatus Dojkabacteria bacterium]